PKPWEVSSYRLAWASKMPIFRSNTRFVGGLRGDGWATPEYYGAQGLLTVNDLNAFQAACTDLANSGGGRLMLGPKAYRLDGPWTIPGSVSVFGVPNDTFLAYHNATSNMIIYSDTIRGAPAVISDVRFIGTSASTGRTIVNAGSRLQLIRCSWNGFDPFGSATTNLQGNLVYNNNAQSETDLIDCRVQVADSVAYGLYAVAGKMRMVRGTLAMPPT